MEDDFFLRFKMNSSSLIISQSWNGKGAMWDPARKKKKLRDVLCSFQSPVYTWFSVCWWPCCPAITRIFLNGTDAVNPYFVWLAYSWLYDRQRKDWYTSPISIDLTPHTSDCPKAKQNIDRGNPRRHNDSCLIAAIEMNKRVSIVLALHS